MTTTFDDPYRLQESGEICESCRLFWENQGMQPLEMVTLVDENDNVVSTDEHGIPIVVCPYCDGGIL